MMKKQRILLFIDSLGAGGAQRQIVGLAVMLKQLSYCVSLIYYCKQEFYKNNLDDEGVENNYISDSSRPLKRIIKVRRYIKKYNPDVVISYLDTPNVITSIVRLSGLRFKYIASERNTSQKNNYRDMVKFLLMRTADYIVPNSYSQENFIRTKYKKLSGKLVTITNFVDLNYFNRIQKHKIDEVRRVLVVASIWPPKNTIGFIKAIKIAINSDANFHVKWYGLTDDMNEYAVSCKKLIADLGLQKYIELLDKTKDIVESYKMSDIFCLPSFYEGTPNAICEAISCGLPVVCSDVCDNNRYVKEGINGFLFDPNNPEDIADKFLKMLSLNQELYDMYSSNSRKIAVKQLSKDRFIKQYIDIIESRY